VKDFIILLFVDIKFEDYSLLGYSVVLELTDVSEVCSASINAQKAVIFIIATEN